MTQTSSPQRIPRLSTNRSKSTAARWQAVINRDANVDRFVYGVLTTRIYCRPSCPARLARRANVTFYDTPPQAEAAGFRPCKRCKPEAANPQQAVIQKACATIESEIRAGLKPKLQRLADEANLTPSHFHRTFKKALGVTPGQYAARMLDSCRRRREISDSGCGVDANGGHTATAGLCDINILEPYVAGDGASSELYADGSGGLGLGLWNEFDFLLAAENGDCSEQGMQLLDELFLPMAGFQGPPNAWEDGEASAAADAIAVGGSTG